MPMRTRPAPFPAAGSCRCGPPLRSLRSAPWRPPLRATPSPLPCPSRTRLGQRCAASRRHPSTAQVFRSRRVVSEGRCGAGDCLDPVQVEVPRHRGADALDDRREIGRLLERRQAEVALGDGQLREVREHPEHLDPAVALHGVAQLPLVPGAAHAVEHDPGHVDRGVEGDLPLDERRHAPAQALGVHHEEHGQAEEAGQRRAAVRARGVESRRGGRDSPRPARGRRRRPARETRPRCARGPS